jgi:TatD DNase family protein
MERCFQNGITRLFLPNVDVDSIEKVFETVEAYPNHCFPMLGLHPCDVKENYQDQLDQIYSKIQQSTIYAIGEIGIDLYWDKSTLAIQQDAFAQQINWAKDLGLPISIHCREAFDEVFEVLDAHADERLFGIFHCFTGTLEQAHRAIKLGFKLGIGGILTYKKSGLDAVVKEIDLEHIVLETDAPYLAPVPFRGKENESSYLIHIAQKLADIHETGIDKVAEITTNNSKNVFKI